MPNAYPRAHIPALMKIVVSLNCLAFLSPVLFENRGAACVHLFLLGLMEGRVAMKFCNSLPRSVDVVEIVHTFS